MADTHWNIPTMADFLTDQPWPVRGAFEARARPERGRRAVATLGLSLALALAVVPDVTILAHAFDAGEPPVPAVAVAPPRPTVAFETEPRLSAPSPAVNAPSPAVAPAALDIAALPKPGEPMAPAAASVPPTAIPDDSMTAPTFLDRLMRAESGGRDTAKNPRSTALGPFQFIESTFLEVVRRHLAQDTAGMTDAQILSLRTDRDFSRRAAEAFNADNAAMLAAEQVPVTFPNLRLAFLLGPTAAVRVLQAAPETPVAQLVGPGVIFANPFMAGLTVADLAARAARDLSLPAPRTVARPRIVPPPRVAVALANVQFPAQADRPEGSNSRRGPRPAPVAMRRTPSLVVLCNRDLPSCRRWVDLHTRLLAARNGGPRRRGISTAQR